MRWLAIGLASLFLALSPVAHNRTAPVLAAPMPAQDQPGPPAAAPGPFQAVAELLGMTPAELVAQLRAGRSLADVAAEHGVDQATLVQTLTRRARERLDRQVAAGRLTPEQADALFQRLTERVAQLVTQTPPRGFWRFGRGPRFGFHGFRRFGHGPAFGFPGFRHGMRVPPALGAFRASLRATADLLGMTPAELVAQLRAGRSLADVAAEHGVDQATLVQTLTRRARERLDRQVAAGRLTPEQADALFQRLTERVERFVTTAPPAGPPPRRRGGGPGPEQPRP
jgi:lambda repressor-like predicted transcriptional regulator